MKTISTTEARKNIAALIDQVKETDEVIGIGRRNNLEALIIKFPNKYNKKFSDIANINTASSSFDFLNQEPDLYSVDDLKKTYV